MATRRLQHKHTADVCTTTGVFIDAPATRPGRTNVLGCPYLCRLHHVRAATEESIRPTTIQSPLFSLHIALSGPAEGPSSPLVTARVLGLAGLKRWYSARQHPASAYPSLHSLESCQTDRKSRMQRGVALPARRAGTTQLDTAGHSLPISQSVQPTPVMERLAPGPR